MDEAQSLFDLFSAFGLLFRVNDKITRDCRIALNGKLYPSHANQLPETDVDIRTKSRRYRTTREAASEGWTFYDLDPPTSKWKPGEYALTYRKIEAHAVPHMMRVGVYGVSYDKSRLGNHITIPWYADL